MATASSLLARNAVAHMSSVRAQWCCSDCTRATLNPASVARATTVADDGSQPLGKISAGMNRKLQDLECQHQTGGLAFLEARPNDRVQQQDTVAGQRVVGHSEKRAVAVGSKVFERADRHDAIDVFAEFFPAGQQYPPGAMGDHGVEHRLHIARLVRRQRQTDNVDVVSSDRPIQGGAPPAADVEKSHARPQTQFAQRQVDLGDLGPAAKTCSRRRSRRNCRSAWGRERGERTRRTSHSVLAPARTAGSTARSSREVPFYPASEDGMVGGRTLRCT
jgi:hypothetical protein